MGYAKTQNALRRHLIGRSITPEECREFDLVAHGPIHPEIEKPVDYCHDDKAANAALMKVHKPIRNIVGAMEKRLAEDLSAAGYEMMNTVHWKPTILDAEWQPIRDAFAEKFPKLKQAPRLAIQP
ncbi:hypothetical protein [Roseibium sp.]|uniref:hypothetical protein n=1 Tax=Roseibium sp. TaxID=1936156 RepID=UPI003A96953D